MISHGCFLIYAELVACGVSVEDKISESIKAALLYVKEQLVPFFLAQDLSWKISFFSCIVELLSSCTADGT